MQILFTVLALLSANIAQAAVCSRTLTFADGAVLTAAQLNAEFNAITNCANSLNDDNISSSANILPAKINSTIAGDALTRDGTSGVLSVGVDGVTIETNSDAIRLKDAGITAAKLASDSVTTAKILDANVTTAKIATGAVTTEKLGSLGQQISSSSGTFSTSSTSFVPVTNQSVTITSYGRPVWITFISANTSILSAGVGGFSGCLFRIKRGSTSISEGYAAVTNSAVGVIVPASSVAYLDPVSAGTNTYSLEVARATSADCLVGETKMVAYEL